MKTEKAVGQVLCHDITQIIKGVTKDAVFRKGHVIREEDIPVLLSVGKDHIYIWEKEEGMLHENDAAEVLRSICQNEHMEATEPKEGKINLIATVDGLLKIDRKKLRYVNSRGQMMIASIHGDSPVRKGEKLAGTRIIPLLIEEEKMMAVKEACAGEPIFKILPYSIKKVGIITTGNEVYHGRIKDTFTPVIEQKIKEYGMEVVYHTTLDDNHEKITAACREAMAQGAEFVICTGGMSVDPDDKTPLAIKNTGARVVSYGAPILPGAMFLLAYHGEVPIVGLPGCVMYSKKTIFDIVLPRIAARDEITEEDLAGLGEGGLCMDCKVCIYPNCGFGKGR